MSKDVVKLVIEYENPKDLERLDDRIQAAVDNSSLAVRVFRTFDKEEKNESQEMQ